jgi:hypothetical protein
MQERQLRQTLLAVALLCAATPSSAAVITSTASFTGNALVYDPATDYSPSTGYAPPGSLGGYDGLLTLHGFNSALGTLNSVSLTQSLAISLEFTQAVDIFGNGHPQINAHTYVADQSPYGSFGFANPFTFNLTNTTPYGTTLQTYDTGVQFANDGPSTYTNNIPGTFAPFLAQTIYDPILGYVLLDASTGSYIGNATSTYTYTTTFTYNYTPNAVVPPTSVPEPFTLSIFGAGLAGAFATRRRKTKKS